MLKRTTQTLFLILSSSLLLVSVTASAHAQNDRRPYGRPDRTRSYTVSGTIRWKKDYGVIPMGPGHSQAAVYPCAPFFVAALDSSTNKSVAYTDGLLTQAADQGDYYVCNYSLKVPSDRSLYIVAGMGGVLLLPNMDRSPHYTTAPWIGGNRSRPPTGTERGFTGYKYVTLSGRRTRAFVSFEMLYVRNDDPR
jgi:hypothetical protein